MNIQYYSFTYYLQDPNDDVAGAMKIGLKGIQVKTGKYLPNITVPEQPTAVVENFSEAVDWIINTNLK